MSTSMEYNACNLSILDAFDGLFIYIINPLLLHVVQYIRFT